MDMFELSLLTAFFLMFAMVAWIALEHRYVKRHSKKAHH